MPSLIAFYPCRLSIYCGWFSRPCFRRRCPLIRHRCLVEIGVERVLAETLAALDGAAS